MKTLDAGQAETNKLIEKVEKRVNKEYSQATKDMQKKLNDYLKSFESKDKAMQKQLADGLITEKQYKDWRYGQIMVGKRWQEQLDVLSKDLENSRQIAMNIVSGELPSAYAIGHNYGTFLVESGSKLNTSYTLYDRDTVAKLMKDRPKLLPDPTKGSKTQQALKSKQIQRWSKAKMNSAVAQGVLQGESIPEIAGRLRNVTDMSYRASIRNARTMLTSSENLGRQASFERAQDMGIEMEKQWLATLDDITRDSHALMDGERVPLDENFSNGLEYPADPSGEPEEIYNCRCTMVTAIKGFEKAITDFDLSENEKLNGMSYDEWKDSHLHEPNADDAVEEVVKGIDEEVSEKFEVANGENILETWERREDEFDFEIEDAINAQGFDGLPRVVSAEEFDKAVHESNFIAQRTYSAESKEILDQYRNELYHGKWYVDCSTGGAQYGQGMYCAADYTGTLTEGIKKEMRHYHDIGNQRFGGRETIEAKHYTETFTLDRSAKIIKYSDLFDKKLEWEEGLKNKYVNDALDGWLNEHGLSDNHAAKTFLNFNTQTGNVSWGEATRAHDVLEKEGNLGVFDSYLADARKAKGDAIAKGVDELNEKKINDIGSFATALGYDAINAEGHGLSGSYTVILNRTKVIFKKP